VVTADESLLTGESKPVLKTPIQTAPNKELRLRFETEKSHQTHYLFGGTKLLHVEGERALALVFKPNFLSTKGKMIREMLLIEQSAFPIFVDAVKFLGIMSLVSLFLVLFTIKPMID